MKYETVINVDWADLQIHLGTQEEDPHDLVHELAHAYECIGSAAFARPIGNQYSVEQLIIDKFGDNCRHTHDGNHHEIRVSAISFLVLQPLGHADFVRAVKECSWNVDLAYNNKDSIAIKMLELFSKPRIVEAANIIRDFCMEFEY